MTKTQNSPTVWCGDLPKIGIRPTIDGRLGGVRESLEEQTMNLAKRVADLITGNVRYPNGESVPCVIADTCIGGVAEAAACDDQFRQQNVGVSLTVTPCWCYGSETMDMDPLRPKAVFGFNGTERPARSTWPPCLPATRKKAFRRSASTDVMCRMPVTQRCRPTSRKRSSTSRDVDWRLR